MKRIVFSLTSLTSLTAVAAVIVAVIVTVFSGDEARPIYTDPEDLTYIDVPGARVQIFVKNGDREWRTFHSIPLFVRYTGNPHSGLEAFIYEFTGDRFTVYDKVRESLVYFEVSGIDDALRSDVYLIARSGKNQVALELADNGSGILRSGHILPSAEATNLELSNVQELVCSGDEVTFFLGRLGDADTHAGQRAEPNKSLRRKVNEKF